jgi:hypothetical protein
MAEVLQHGIGVLRAQTFEGGENAIDMYQGLYSPCHEVSSFSLYVPPAVWGIACEVWGKGIYASGLNDSASLICVWGKVSELLP